MAEFDLNTPDGRKFRLRAPDGATPEQIQQVAHDAIRQLSTQGTPELRQQPTALQEATSPQGWLSPSNVGSVGGGALGAIAGAPLGPPGAFLGGVAGAGVGRGVGRASELAYEKLFGQVPQAGTAPMPPQEPPTAGEALGEVGKATQRGMAEQSLGEVGGALMNKVIGKVLSPFAARTAENAPMIEEAKRLGITNLPASVQTGSPGLAQVERFTTRFPLGTETAQEAGTKLLGQVEQATKGVAERISPQTERDLAIVGENLKDAYSTRYKQARQAATGLYDEVEKLVGDTTFQPTNLQQVATTLAEQQQPLAGLGSTAARKGASLARTLTAEQPEMPSIRGPSGVSLDPKSLPAKLLQDMGITTDTAAATPVSFRVLRDIQSRSGDFARKATDPGEKRYFTMIHDAATKDIAAVRETVPRAGEILDIANAWWKRDVVGRFYPRPGAAGEPVNQAVKALKGKDPSKIVAALTQPGVSREMIDKTKKAVGPDQWNNVTAAWLHDIATNKSVNPQTGEFSVQRFLTAISPQRYDPETLRAMLGNVRARDLEGLRNVLEHVQTMGTASANPSETGRAVMGGTQIYGMVRFLQSDPLAAIGTAAGYGAGKAVGYPGVGAGIGAATGFAAEKIYDPKKPLVSQGGIIVLSPPLLARLLFTPGGIQWLTKGLTTSPGTQEAVRIAGQISTRLMPGLMPSTSSGKGTTDIYRESSRQILGGNEAETSEVKHLAGVHRDVDKGKIPDIDKDLKSGKLGVPAIKRILEQSSEKNSEGLVKYLSPDDAFHAFQLANSEEKQWIEPAVRARLEAMTRPPASPQMQQQAQQYLQMMVPGPVTPE